VRDRGPGFDLAAVSEDRRGVRESIVGRMARHGGRATITAAPGAGTEVELVLERGSP
ncbi:MAG: histidine kinase, partial [Solirubrobacterales bacterium]|nr:histidine kinase [Solirubrobacterales bacterium]